MGLRLDAPTLEEFERARIWRNNIPETLRTPYLLTKEQQEHFYQTVVCDRNSRARFWSIKIGQSFIGLAGLLNIEWENGLAEISLILCPAYRGEGCGEAALVLLLDEGFGSMGLDTIYGECYKCNQSIDFWATMVKRFKGYSTTLPRRKCWQGQLHDSMYFSFTK